MAKTVIPHLLRTRSLWIIIALVSVLSADAYADESISEIHFPLPPLFLEHFWLITGALWLVGTRISPAHPARYLLRRFGVIILLACTLLWVIQLTTGPMSNPFIFLWSAPQRWLGLGVAVLVWIGTIVWLLLCDGAQKLSTAFGVGPKEVKTRVLLGLTICAISAGVMFIFRDELINILVTEFSL
ncbi:hypothetical protein OAM69_02275 [bacterium]|nr:hypothetical protein [bacterium]